LEHLKNGLLKMIITVMSLEARFVQMFTGCGFVVVAAYMAGITTRPCTEKIAGL